MRTPAGRSNRKFKPKYIPEEEKILPKIYDNFGDVMPQASSITYQTKDKSSSKSTNTLQISATNKNIIPEIASPPKTFKLKKIILNNSEET